MGGGAGGGCPCASPPKTTHPPTTQTNIPNHQPNPTNPTKPPHSIFRERLAKLLGPGVSVDMALVSKFRDADGRVLRQLIGDVQGYVSREVGMDAYKR